MLKRETFLTSLLLSGATKGAVGIPPNRRGKVWSFSGTQLGIFPLGDPKKPFQQTKMLLGKLVTRNSERPVQSPGGAWSQQMLPWALCAHDNNPRWGRTVPQSRNPEAQRDEVTISQPEHRLSLE